MTEHELFSAALDRPDAAARAALLDEVCAGDPERRRRIDALLQSHEGAGSFLVTPAAVVPNPADGHPAASGVTDDTATQDGTGLFLTDRDEDLRSVLSPPTRAGSLGRLGHYEILQVLGRGGFGVVFRAFDDILQRVVAVKMMAPQMAATSPARKRFLREARASAAVRHENVVQIYEVSEQPLPYLVMEFIPGETLQQRIDRSGPLDVTETLRIARQIAEGLAAAHSSGLIHRDIKPGNVLLEGGTHRVKITDFGLARAADDASMTQSGVIAGTPLYMAPGQALGHSLDQRADLFSLGSVVYQIVTGRPPFRASSTLAVMKRVAEDTPRPIREIIPEAPQWLGDIISKLHAKNPADRFHSAREVADVLADCEAQLNTGSRLRDFSRIPRISVNKAERPGRRKWLVASLLLLPLLGLTGTELAGITRWFGGSSSANQPGNATGAGVAKSGPLNLAPADSTNVKNPMAARELVEPAFKNSIGMEFVVVPKGKSWLGGAKERPGEKEVQIAADFYLGQYEVTQEEWEKVMGENPSRLSRLGADKDAVKDIPDADLKRFPVENVSWEDCQAFLARLNGLEKQAGWVYRLPTDVEWEYACRGGPMADRAVSAFDYYFKEPTNELLPEHLTWNSGSSQRCEKVGSHPANKLGLFDMHGNVWEWSNDTFMDAEGATMRRFLGGSWQNQPQYFGAGFRVALHPPTNRFNGLGLRVARVQAAIMNREPAAAATPAFKNSVGMEFVIVPKGKSWLGGFKDKLGDKEVEIVADFYLGKYEVTQEEWKKVMGENPSHFSRTGKGADAVKEFSDEELNRFPVESVSWDLCQVFVERLNKLEKETSWRYRLPNSEEWEYACRGGPIADKAESAFSYYLAEPRNTLSPELNTSRKLNRTCKVGSSEANRLGLVEMHGNVWEWCNDPFNADDTSIRTVRGGCFGGNASESQAGRRDPHQASQGTFAIGLRIARVPTGAAVPEAKTPAAGSVP